VERKVRSAINASRCSIDDGSWQGRRSAKTALKLGALL